MTANGINPRSYVPQDQLYVWALVDPSHPTLVGEVKLSRLVSDCATFAYASPWWNFPLSEDLPIIQGQTFSAGVRGSAPGALDDARPDRWGERVIRHIDRPARLSILEMLLFAGDDQWPKHFAQHGVCAADMAQLHASIDRDALKSQRSEFLT